MSDGARTLWAEGVRVLITIYGRPTWPWNALALHSSECRDLAMVGPCGLPTKGTRVWSKRRLRSIPPTPPAKTYITTRPAESWASSLLTPKPPTSKCCILRTQLQSSPTTTVQAASLAAQTDDEAQEVSSSFPRSSIIVSSSGIFYSLRSMPSHKEQMRTIRRRERMPRMCRHGCL